MPRRPREPPPPPPFTALLAVLLEHCELSRDRHGVTYVAAPGSAATAFYRVRLDGADAVTLVRQIWGEAHRAPDGRRPAVRLTIPMAREAIAELHARAAVLPREPHSHRVARTAAGRVILDLGWADWRAIEVSAQGWRVLNRPPLGVRFLRSAQHGPLPRPRKVPRTDPILAELQQLFPTVRGDRMAVLMATLAFALVSGEDHPLILIHGRSQAGKSTLAAFIRDILDPSEMPFMPLGRGDAVRNLLTAGSHDRVLALDNLSVLERDVADMLCLRLDGRGGGRFRALHTNQDLAVVPSAGPMLLTTIAPLLGHADLADRSIILNVEEVPDAAGPRLGSVAMRKRLAELAPRLLGRLLDAAVLGLARAGEFGPVPGFRNVELATFAQAAAPALGESAAGMAEMLAEMGRYQRAVVAGAAPVAAALLDVLAVPVPEQGEREMLPQGMLWRGTAAKLLTELARVPSVRMDPTFPRTGAALVAELIRLRAVLESAGLRFAFRRAERAARGPVGAARWIELWDATGGAGDGGADDGQQPEPAPVVH